MDKNSNGQNQDSTYSFSTKVINTTYAKPDIHGAISFPIYRNSAFEFNDSKSIAEAFQYKTDIHTYSRITNPTVTNFEEKVRIASGAQNVVALASGMAAISNTFLTVAYSGCNIISSPHLFGNSFSFLRNTLSSFGVEVRFVDTNNLEEIVSAIDSNTCAFFAEIITNPHIEIADLPEISKIMKANHIPMIIDTTLIPWFGFDARMAGIDIEVVSTTKYVSGGATGIGGVIIDHDTHDWTTNQKLGVLPKPKGMSRFMFKLRSEIMRNVGACMSPDAAYMQSLGMEHLELRYLQMSETAYKLALHLTNNNKISEVNYPKLHTSPYKALSDKLFTGNPGAMFTISLSSKDNCYKFMDSLKIIHLATNLFDNKSLVIHPESTIYGTFPPELKKVMGIKDNLIRFSVGLEKLEDLIGDIEQALDKTD